MRTSKPSLASRPSLATYGFGGQPDLETLAQKKKRLTWLMPTVSYTITNFSLNISTTISTTNSEHADITRVYLRTQIFVTLHVTFAHLTGHQGRQLDAPAKDRRITWARQPDKNTKTIQGSFVSEKHSYFYKLMKFDFLYGCFSNWKTTGPDCSSATKALRVTPLHR